MLTLGLRRPQPLPGLAMSSRRCWTLPPLAATNVGTWPLQLLPLPQALHVAAACGGQTDHFAETQGQPIPLPELSLPCCCIVWETSWAVWPALHHANTCRSAVA